MFCCIPLYIPLCFMFISNVKEEAEVRIDDGKEETAEPDTMYQ